MIKKEILSTIINLLPKEDKTGKYHPRFIEAVIENVLIGMYKQVYERNPRLVDNYTVQYGETTAIDITLDAVTGIYYSTIPARIVSLPCKNSGVRRIYSFDQTDASNDATYYNAFVPMDSTEADMIFNTDIAIVTSKIGYRVRQDTQVDYYNTNAFVRAAGVRMDLLIPFSVYTDTDVVHIPEFSEKEGGSFTQRVLQVLGVIQPKDLKDNNSPAMAQANNQ